jgi:hydrogenase maturation protein HypF
MTSGNRSDEPIAYDDADAVERLAEIADALLVGNRAIHMRTDDSVVRAVDRTIREAPVLIRRSRGYAPASIPLPAPASRQVLGCGAELKNTFCLAKGERAWVGHHIGDLKNFETLESYRAGIDHFERLFAVEPQVVAHDLHPDYLATRYALAREGVETVAVQHHHAHMAACLAEHGFTEPAIGAIFDGAGYGADGTVWGGEILAGDLAGFERAGLLFPVRLPGGDAATLQPWRMACAWLGAAFETDAPPMPATLADAVSDADWNAVCGLISSGLNSPLTTSAGRLFDAVAAICGLRATVSHEAQAAAELEGLASRSETRAYPMGLLDDRGDGLAVIDAREAIRVVFADVDAGADVAVISARFHNALADATARACMREAEGRGLDRVVLSGGVFQNRLLLEGCARRLRDVGLEVLFPAVLPPNDGGIAYGQVAVAMAREASR